MKKSHRWSSSNLSATASASTGSHSSGDSGDNLWNRLIQGGDSEIWKENYDAFFGAPDDLDEEKGDPPCSSGGSSLKRTAYRLRSKAAGAGLRRRLISSLSSHCATLRRHPFIPLLSLAVFGLSSGLGLWFVTHASDSYETRTFDLARTQAVEALDWFSDEFDRALAPLFALAQVVKHDEGLCRLAKRIGNRGEEGAAPGWPVGEFDDPDIEFQLRDVRGICDDPGLLERFADVAESIKKDSGLGSVLSGLRVAPVGVMCMIHPLINYVDYDHVVRDGDAAQPVPYYNGTKRLFNDWAWDYPFHMNVLRKTYEVQEAEQNRITITGPFKIKSAAGDGTILTETLFCAHLGVSVPNHTSTMAGGLTFDSWGFVMSFVNWAYLVDKSNIDERFMALDMMYELNRTFAHEDAMTGETIFKTDTIAHSEQGCITTTAHHARISIPKTVNGDDWTLSAGFTCATRPPWEAGAKATVVATSCALALLVMFTLVKQRQHRDLLYKMMPRSAIRKLNRGQTVVEKFNVVTIFFSDIVGFTSMAGEMRPIDVMRMLNALYVEFDKICEKHDVYKVETIGDAYMVMGGAPDRCSGPEGAEKVALFALDAIECVKTFRLTMTPANGESRIFIRAGIASGPVVAGVVGNTMPRYCLFGDTVNFASRMESTSHKMRIQCSELTRSLLEDAPSCVFDLQERRDQRGRHGCEVKGKGWMETWWITGATKNPTARNAHQNGERGERRSLPSPVPLEKPTSLTPSMPARRRRSESIPYVLDVAVPSKKLVNLAEGVSLRNVEGSQTSSDTSSSSSLMDQTKDSANVIAKALTMQPWTVLGRGADSLMAATSDKAVMIERMAALLERHLINLMISRTVKGASSHLKSSARQQLRSYVSKIESLYNDVDYHSFEHASHVTISVNKILHILVRDGGDTAGLLSLHADPMAQFATVYAALVHDVGHLGVTNGMLVKQGNDLVCEYGKESTAEKHSIETAFSLLFQDKYADLRAAMFASDKDEVSFLLLVRTAVLATDIASKERTGACLANFEREFGNGDGADSKEEGDELCQRPQPNISKILSALRDSIWSVPLDPCLVFPSPCTPTAARRNISVIEHIIQIADVAHLMQGWANCIKWNYRLFKELRSCHRLGLLSDDPVDGWSAGQTSFFDGYIIPLGRRMLSTGALGPRLGSKLIKCAEDSRKLWSKDGDAITEIMVRGADSGEEEAKTIELILRNSTGCVVNEDIS